MRQGGSEANPEPDEAARRDPAQEVLARLGRMKTIRFCCCGVAGKKRSLVIRKVAQPSGPVGRSTPVNCWYGVGVA